MASSGCRRASTGHDAALLALLLVLLLEGQPVAAVGTLSMDEEGTAMRTLRQRLSDARLTPAGWHGWQPGDKRPHCSWRRVRCSSMGRVIVIDLQWDTVPPLPPPADSNPSPLRALLPELARFASLRQLILNLYFAPPVAAIPPQWGHADAFPALELLEITVPTLQGALPDVEPGALPQLTSMHIEASDRVTWAPLTPTQQRTSSASGSSHPEPAAALQRGAGLRSRLPPSWGASPDVLPALEELSLMLHVEPPLPAAWARGFRRLRRLYIAAPPNAPLPAATGNVLPPEWADGFPTLRWLDLLRLGITGSIPTAWAERGFPLLTQLNMATSALTGPLPDQLLETHPALQTLNLELNNLTGTLPAAWADAQALDELSLRGNRLTGPLFPPAWLAPGAMPRLKFLLLADNPGLVGSLPDWLPWLELTSLSLAGTGLQASAIPSSWCSSPNAAIFTIIDASNTSVAPELPPCAVKAMPSLTLLSGNQTVNTGARSAAETAQPGERRLLTAVAAAWLALMALGGAAGLAVRRHRLCRQAGALKKRAEERETRLLIEERASELSGLRHDVSRTQRASICSRQHRLESILRSQLGGPCSRIEVMHLEQLPAAMAHQLAPRRGGHAASACGSHAAASAAAAVAEARAAPAMLSHTRLPAVEEEQQHNGWGSFDSNGSGSGGRSSGDSSTSGLLEASAVGPPASRQWGLETDSLRLALGELELLSGPDGALCLLGEGSSSAVFLGRLTGHEDVAVKVIELTANRDSRHVWHEVSLLRTCVHRRLVALLGVACQGQLLMLVMELMRGGDLHSALQRPATRDALHWAARGRQVALDVAEALAYLHSCGVQHADLKPSNVMLTGDLRAKLTDLGVAQQLGSRSRQAVGGTTQYAAPEQLLGLPCTTKADVYSLGVLLTVLCTGRPLAARGQLRLPAAPADCPQQVLDLIQQCICPDPGRRPTAEEALRRLHAA